MIYFSAIWIHFGQTHDEIPYSRRTREEESQLDDEAVDVGQTSSSSALVRVFISIQQD